MFVVEMRLKPKHYFCLTLLLICSCSQQRIEIDGLEAAADCIESRPDSALVYLKEIADTDKFSDRERALYYLLLTKVTYKLYLPVPPDSMIAFSQRYYEKNNIENLLSESLYYRAMTLYERGLRQQAMELLKQGEQLAEKLGDALLLSKYYENIYRVHYEAGNHDLELKYAKKFLEHSLFSKDTDCIARAYSHVSTAYDNMHNPDSMQFFLNETIRNMVSADSVDLAYILANIGCTRLLNGDTVEAEKILKTSLQIKPIDNTYNTLAYLYSQRGDTLKAMNLWRKTLEFCDLKTRTIVLSTLIEHYKNNCDYKKALLLSDSVILLKDSLYRVADKKAITEIHRRYDHQLVLNKYYRILCYSLIGCILVLLTTIAATYYHKKKMKAYSVMINSIMLDLKKSEQILVEYENNGHKNEQEISKLNKKIENLRQAYNERIRVGREVFELAKKNENFLKIKDAESCLIDYYSIYQYNTFNSWMVKFPKLTPRLLTYLILNDMGKSDAEIANALCISDSTVRSVKFRLRNAQKSMKQ